jgi:hypothetical protein
MTSVRQRVNLRAGAKNVTNREVVRRNVAASEQIVAAAKTPSRSKQARREGGQAAFSGTGSHVAQVRLQADEMAALREVMRQRSLPSTSEALREGIRLLIREAAEIAAAEEIQSFYGQQPVPLPEGVVPATAEDLAAADAAQW